MPIITKIKPNKIKNSVSVFVDGKYCFTTDLETYLRSKIKVEDEISEKQIDKIKKNSSYKLELNLALKFATLRPRSENEIENWIKKRKITPKVREKIIRKLKKLDLINDLEFARWWLGQRLNFKSRSKLEISSELRKKGIAKRIIEEVFAETGIDEEAIATKLIEKKLYRFENLSNLKKRKKISDYLLRKGYSWDVVKNVLKKFID